METNNHRHQKAFFVGMVFLALIFGITLFRLLHSSQINQKDVPDENASQEEILSAIKEAKKISPEELSKKITSQSEISVIDIRNEEAYTNEHIPNSINIPLIKIQESIKILDKNKNYFLIDNDSSLLTTAYAVRSFKDVGFDKIIYAEGGFLAWKNNFYPTISAGNPKNVNDQAKVRYITSDKLRNIAEKENSIALIDVRKSQSYLDGHLKNAFNIFLGDLESKKKDIPARKMIVVYDDDGTIDAFQAGVRLFDMGFFNVYVLSDGLNTWKNKKFEIVR